MPKAVKILIPINNFAELIVGDVVTVDPLGPEMIVSAVPTTPEGTITCEWVGLSARHTLTFAPDVLLKPIEIDA